MNEIIEVNFLGTKYNIKKLVIERLNNIGVTINDDYCEYLFQYHNPYSYPLSEFDIFQMMNCDFLNRILYNYKKGLGNILVYNKKMDIIAEYDSLKELLYNINESDLFYGFRKLHDKGIYPAKRIIDFFGVKINFYDNNPYLEKLRRLIKSINVWRNGVGAKKEYNSNGKDIKKRYTFENFVKQKINYCSFSLGEIEFSVAMKLKEEKDILGTEEEYRKEINILFNRYSLNGICCFEEVKDLNLLNHYTGIYILCFDSERKYYIGQATTSLKQRIINHFTQPSSQFDDAHKPIDVSKIYVLRVLNEHIDLIEQDCIASIKKEYLLNKLIGGKTVLSIYDKEYNPKNYMLPKKIIINIIKAIPSIEKINDKKV